MFSHFLVNLAAYSLKQILQMLLLSFRAFFCMWHVLQHIITETESFIVLGVLFYVGNQGRNKLFLCLLLSCAYIWTFLSIFWVTKPLILCKSRNMQYGHLYEYQLIYIYNYIIASNATITNSSQPLTPRGREKWEKLTCIKQTNKCTISTQTSSSLPQARRSQC